MKTLRNLTFHTFCVALALCMAAAPALAHPRGPRAPYTVTVEDPGGRELRTFHQAGRTYVLGEWGERYNIRVENHTGRRVEAVVSVDGRDVISGRIGDYVNGRGYLIDAYDSVVIEGFRQSMSQVAAFRFTEPSDSYSSRMGTPQHVGVIGVAVFPERQHRIARVAPRPRPRPIPRRHAERRNLGTGSGRSRNPNPRAMPGKAKGYTDDSEMAAAEAAPRARSSAPRSSASRADRSYDEGVLAESESSLRRQNLGTQYGESHESHVYEVQFQRASQRNPAQVITLHYDDREGLLARGIHVDRRDRITRYYEPSPFPESRFAPPPPY